MKNINDAQFKNQIEYIKDKVRKHENIGLDLIELLNYDGLIEWVHQNAKNVLKRMLLSYSGLMPKDAEIVVISLSLIGMMKYDGNFYEYVKEAYEELYNEFSEQKIAGTIRSVLKSYYTVKDDKRSRIINVALSNAIVPVNYLPGFFDFIFDIYRLNFDYELPDNLYDEFKFVYKSLREIMLSEGDDIQLNITKKSYKLIHSTKELIAHEESLDSVIGLSVLVVQLIDNRIWGRKNDISNIYLKSGYEKWEIVYRNKEEQKSERKETSYRSRWKSKYFLNQNDIYLVPPIHQIADTYDYSDIVIVVKNGNEVIYRQDKPYIKKVIGGYQIIGDKIQLGNPLGKISYWLMAGEEVIFNSETTLYREYMVFDENGNELRNNTDYSGTITVCALPAYKRPYFRSEYYGLTAVLVDQNTILMLGEDVFGFTSVIKPEIYGDEINRQYLRYDKTGELLKVFSNIEGLKFISANDNLAFEIEINNRTRMLSDFNYRKTQQKALWRYDVEISDARPGINDIFVYSTENNKREKIASFRLVYDPVFEIHETKINDYMYEVHIQSVFFEKAVDDTLILYDYSEDWLNVNWRGEKYSYLVPLDLNAYRIMDGKWYSTRQDMWIEDIEQNSALELLETEIDSISVYSEKGEILQEGLSTKDCNWYRKVAIGFLKSYKEIGDYTLLSLLSQGRQQGAIFCYNHCVFNEQATEINFDPVKDELYITPEYSGKGNVILEITDEKGGTVYKEENIQSEETYVVQGLKSFINYQVEVCEKKKGLSLEKDRKLMEKSLKLYARDNLVGRYYQITEIQYDQLIRGELVRKDYYFNKVYVYFSDKESEDVFQGNIVTKTAHKIFDLNKINPVKIEICSDIIDDEMEVSITKDGDGLLLDFEHHDIMNELDDNKATDIFLYTIKMDGTEEL